MVYLAECELREELTTEEIDQIRRLSPVNNPVRLDESAPWHSSDFREVYLSKGKNKRIEVTLHNALRALCQLLLPHLGKSVPFTDIQPKIGDLANKLDQEDKINPPSPTGTRRIHDLLRTKSGAKLKKFKIIKVSGARERFVKLSSPHTL
ncbi:MAG: hypothetical protein ABIV39_02000 [Verrucomicrobiota bacterium]